MYVRMRVKTHTHVCVGYLVQWFTHYMYLLLHRQRGRERRRGAAGGARHLIEAGVGGMDYAAFLPCVVGDVREWLVWLIG